MQRHIAPAGSSVGDDLSPSAARSITALLRRRPLSWREAMDDSALMASAFLGAAVLVFGVRVLRRH